jgi:peroxiredoxin Q/BCP
MKSKLNYLSIYAGLILIACLSFQVNGQNDLTLKEGMKAPDFELKDNRGKPFKLSSYLGKSPVVVYFYPKAGTPGCTKQACGIRDDWSKFKNRNIKVVGISTDSKADLKKFARKYNLYFPLLSDEGKLVSKKYGVLRADGKDKRVTFIIDKNGEIAKILEVTDISRHAIDVFDIASKL